IDAVIRAARADEAQEPPRAHQGQEQGVPRPLPRAARRPRGLARGAQEQAVAPRVEVPAGDVPLAPGPGAFAYRRHDNVTCMWTCRWTSTWTCTSCRAGPRARS